MGLEYLKITPDIMVKISAYGEAEQGRLILAMIAYALGGEEPEFDGMERFIWPVLKMDIDRCAASVEKQSSNGNKGGRPAKRETQAKPNENQQNPTETQINPTKPSETQAKPNESLNSNTKTNIKTNNQEEDVGDARAGDPAATTVEAFDGSDLSEDIRINAEVDGLLRQYRMSEAVRGDLLEDIAKHGLDTVKRVMQEAAQSDTKGGLSIKFIRACLANAGKPRESRASPGRGDVMQRHNYTAEDFAAMAVDLDAGD